jgi:cyclopropane fatty-acyl-phospholipid synthase-like methyltransferase
VTVAGRNSLQHPRYPRSNNYDPQWVIDNQMGPNALWLIEALTEAMQITPGMRVLDLGCGTALTSIFLAREFGAQVWATDLWIEGRQIRSESAPPTSRASLYRSMPRHTPSRSLGASSMPS